VEPARFRQRREAEEVSGTEAEDAEECRRMDVELAQNRAGRMRWPTLELDWPRKVVA
jgi:hypothetical protein